MFSSFKEIDSKIKDVIIDSDKEINSVILKYENNILKLSGSDSCNGYYYNWIKEKDPFKNLIGKTIEYIEEDRHFSTERKEERTSIINDIEKRDFPNGGRTWNDSIHCKLYSIKLKEAENFEFYLIHQSNGYYYGWLQIEDNSGIIKDFEIPNTLTVVIGLPGSGKTYLSNTLNLPVYDDFIWDFYSGKLLEDIRIKDVCINDPRLCNFETFEKFMFIFGKTNNIRLYLFENDPMKCKENSNKHFDIDNLSKIYNVDNYKKYKNVVIPVFSKNCRKILESLFKKNFNKLSKLDIDFYNAKLKLALYHDKLQNYAFKHYGECLELKKKEELRKENCKKLNIHYINIPYTVLDKDIPNFIKKHLPSRLRKLLKS